MALNIMALLVLLFVTAFRDLSARPSRWFAGPDCRPTPSPPGRRHPDYGMAGPVDGWHRVGRGVGLGLYHTQTGIAPLAVRRTGIGRAD